MYEIKCAEVWGGIKNEDLDACSKTMTVSLYSSACDSGKGGDIYYVGVCDKDLFTRIAVADVVGHGQAASSISQWLYNSLQAHMNSLKGNEVLIDLNRMATERGFQAMTTVAVVAVCKADDNAYFSYAGHHPVLLRRRDDVRWTPVRLDREGEGLVNLPLGVSADVTYTQRSLAVQSGDRLLLYTDGVIETPDSRGRLFGMERLGAVLEEVGTASLFELKSALLAALRRHSGGEFLHDDVTLMAVEVR